MKPFTRCMHNTNHHITPILPSYIWRRHFHQWQVGPSLWVLQKCMESSNQHLENQEIQSIPNNAHPQGTTSNCYFIYLDLLYIWSTYLNQWQEGKLHLDNCISVVTLPRPVHEGMKPFTRCMHNTNPLPILLLDSFGIIIHFHQWENMNSGSGCFWISIWKTTENRNTKYA